MNSHDDDLPAMNAEPSDSANDFRAREKKRISVREEHDEGMPSVNRKTKGGKLTNILGLFFIGFIGIIFIYWINFGSKDKAEEVPKPKSGQSVESGMPPLGRTPTPKPTAPVDAISTAAQGSDAPPPPPTPKRSNGRTKPEDLPWYDRKLAGAVVSEGAKGEARNSGQGERKGNDPKSLLPDPNSPYPPFEDGGDAPVAATGDGLGSKLTPTPLVGVSASLLKNMDYLIEQGRPIDCTLGTAVDTSLPGLITCTVTKDIYSVNGQVLLMERGTFLTGEQQGGLKQGQARVFALWTRARTPSGAVINLNSPGTDSLGRSGLEGWVDNHFIDRFGGALLMTVFNASLQYAIEREKETSGSTVITDSSGEGSGIVDKVLENTINIPPTLVKNQGDQIQVMVARDLDFSTVYSLQVTE